MPYQVVSSTGSFQGSMTFQDPIGILFSSVAWAAPVTIHFQKLCSKNGLVVGSMLRLWAGPLEASRANCWLPAIICWCFCRVQMSLTFSTAICKWFLSWKLYKCGLKFKPGRITGVDQIQICTWRGWGCRSLAFCKTKWLNCTVTSKTQMLVPHGDCSDKIVQSLW